MMKTAIKHKSRKHKSRHFRRFLKANEAVSALEYAVLVGVIATAVVAAIGLLGDEIKDVLDVAKDKVVAAEAEANKAR